MTLAAEEGRLLDVLFEKMPIAVAILDRGYRVVRRNPAYAACVREHQPPGSAAPDPGAHYFDMVPGTEEVLEPMMRRALAGETVRESALQLGIGDETSYWDMTFAPLIQGDEVAGIIEVAIDITPQVFTERLARARESEFQAIFEAATDGIIINDPLTGRVAVANPAACRMHGYTKEQFEGIEPFAFVHPDSHELYRDYVNTVSEGGVFRTRAQDVRKDGTVIDVEVTGRRFDYRGRPHLLAVVRDVTEEVRTLNLLRDREAQLAASEAELKALFSAITDGIFQIAPDGTCLRVAPTSPEYIRIPTEDVLGKRFQEIFPEIDEEQFLGIIDGALTTGETVAVEYELILAGGPAWFAARCSPLGDGTVLWVSRDITKRVHAYQLLEQRVSERTRELRTLLEVARDVGSTLEIGPLLALILDQLANVIDYTSATVFTLRDNRLVAMEHRGPLANHPAAHESSYPVMPGSVDETILTTMRPLIIDDLHDPDGPKLTGPTGVEGPLPPDLAYVRSWMGVPLVYRERAIGMLAIDHDQPGHLQPEHAEIATAFAAQAAVAIENARLFGEANQRARENEALADIASALAFDQPFQETLDDLTRRVVAATTGIACSLTLLDEQGNFVQGGHHGLPADFPLRIGDAVAAGAPNPSRIAFHSGERVVVRNIRQAGLQDGRWAAVHESLRQVDWDTLVVTPLTHRGRSLGTLDVYYRADEEPDDDELRVISAITNQTALAVENSRLFAETAQRMRELDSLYRADAVLHRSLRIADVLEAMVDVAEDILSPDKTAVLTWDADANRLVTRLARGFISEPEALSRTEGIRTRVRDAFQTGGLVIVEDAAADPNVNREVAERDGIKSFMHAPLLVAGEIFGVLNVNYTTQRTFSMNDKRLFMAIAQRAALALENARLYEQSQQVASLKERQRLARELHDSVSQALYGIALGARTARTLFDQDPAKATQPMDYVLGLAEAGLAEMRALIFELRPESLETEGLVAAIEKQVASLRARYGFEVTADLCPEPEVTLGIKEALYRIAQEAMHNAVKHARARQVIVRLAERDGRLNLEVRDNGIGFDPSGEFPGHLGLRSMRERTNQLGGALTIQSAPGEGTSIRADLPARRPTKA